MRSFLLTVNETFTEVVCSTLKLGSANRFAISLFIARFTTSLVVFAVGSVGSVVFALSAVPQLIATASSIVLNVFIMFDF